MSYRAFTDKQLDDAMNAAKQKFQFSDYSDDEYTRRQERIDANNTMDAIRAEQQRRKK